MQNALACALAPSTTVRAVSPPTITRIIRRIAVPPRGWSRVKPSRRLARVSPRTQEKTPRYAALAARRTTLHPGGDFCIVPTFLERVSFLRRIPHPDEIRIPHLHGRPVRVPRPRADGRCVRLGQYPG